jgi:hypothetical protein
MVCTDRFGNSCNKTITLHFKILKDPTNFSPQAMLDAMTKIYGSLAKIRVNLGSTERLPAPPHLTNLTVKECRQFDMTDQQNELFNNRNNVRDNHIVVYFIKRTIPAYNGCAAYKPNKPSCVIVKDASLWTLAHEVCHVLECGHADNESNCLFKRLMTTCGTSRIRDPPPDFIQSEINTMTNSSLCENC